MSQSSKAGSVDLAGLWLHFWFMINSGACIATCSSNSCFNTLVISVIKHRRQVWGTGWIHWSLSPKEMFRTHSSVLLVLKTFPAYPYPLGAFPAYLWESDTNWMFRCLFLLFEQSGAQQKSLLPIWAKNSSSKDSHIRRSTGVNKLPARMQLAHNMKKDYGTCGNCEYLFVGW